MVGERLRQARTAAGLTQDQVVGRLRELGLILTKGGLSKYERSGSLPKPTLLRALARVLGVETTFFLEDPQVAVRWLAFRKAPQLSQARQEQVKSLAESQLELILGLRHTLQVAEPDRPHPKLRVETAADAERAAERVREHWQLGCQPIESLTSAIEDNGGVVIESASGSDLFDGLAGWANESIPVVVVSARAPADRRRFSLAHEIGHLFMEIDPALDPNGEEKLAHRFAAALLVPAETARRELGEHRRKLDFQELEILKLKHGLSMQAWIYRAVDLGILEGSAARSLVTAMSAKGWRRREPVDLQNQERPLKLQQLVLRALAEGSLSLARAQKIWPDLVYRENNSVEPGLSTRKSRSFLDLAPVEKNGLLKRMAEDIAPEYEPGGRLAGLESLAEEDYFEPGTQ